MGNADRYLNNLRPCLNTEGYGGEEPPSIKNGPNLFYGWEGSGGGRERTKVWAIRPGRRSQIDDGAGD